MKKPTKNVLKPSLLGYAIAVATASLTQGAFAVDLCAGSTHTVSDDQTGNSCSLDANTALTVTVDGILGGAAYGGSTVGNPVLVTGTGVTISNAGSINAGAVSSTSVTATAIRYDDVALTNALTNTGDIRVHAYGGRAYAYGVSASGLSGTLSNVGTYSTEGDILSGVIRARADGSYSNPYGGSAYANASAVGVDISDDVTGGIVNSGEISAAAYQSVNDTGYAQASATAVGVNVSGDLTSLNNSGTISAYANASANATEGSENSYADATAVYISGAITGTFANSGEISAAGTGEYAYVAGVISSYGGLSGVLANSGDINATAYGGSYGNAVGIYINGYGGGITGAVSNTGSVSVDAYGNSAYSTGISSSGTLEGSLAAGDVDVSAYGWQTGNLAYGTISSNANAYGVSTGDVDGSVVLGGTINAYAHAYAGNYASGTSTSARATANAYAQGVNTGAINGSLTNSGDISVSGYADAYANYSAWGQASMYGLAIQGDINGVLTNTGSIHVSVGGDEATAHGIQSGTLYGTLNNSGEIQAAAYGGSNAYAYGLQVYYGGVAVYGGASGALINSGTIAAQAYGDDNNAYAAGVSLSSALAGTVNNSGTISAEASASSYANATALLVNGDIEGTLTNSGMLSAQADSNDSNANARAVLAYGGLTGVMTNTGKLMASAWASNNAYASALVLAGEVAGTLTNSGTLSAKAISTDNDAYARGVMAYGGLTGVVTNSGKVMATAQASDYATALGAGFYGYGGITGTLTNSGTLSAKAISTDGVANAYGLAAYGYGYGGALNGEVVNTGTIQALAHASYGGDAYGLYVNGAMGGDAGRITNSGTISASVVNDYSSYGGDVGAYGIYQQSGDLTDNAQILNTASGTISAHANAYSTATAYGVVTGSLYDAAQIVNNGVIDVLAHGQWNRAYAYGGIMTGSLSGTAGIINNGTLNVVADGDEYASAGGISTSYMAEDAMVVNNGTLSVSANAVWSTAYAYGIGTGDMYGGQVVNNGTLTVAAIAYSSATATGIYTGSLYDDAKVVNNGTITVTANDLTDLATGYGIYVNSIQSTDSSLTNAGTISVAATGASTAYADAHAVYVSGDVYGTVTNSGRISASADGLFYTAEAYGVYVGGGLNGSSYGGGTLTNSGSITVSASDYEEYAYAYGVYLNSGVYGGAVSNTGSITVSAHGDGTATAEAYGIYSNALYSSDLTNSGTISVTAAAERSWASAYGIDLNYAYSDSSLTNNGTINVTANGGTSASAYGAYVWEMGDSSFTNNGRIAVSAAGAQSQAYAYGYFGHDLYGSAQLVNNGTINVSAAGNTSADANGIYVYAWNGSNYGGVFGTAQIVNNGTINVSATNSGSDSVYAQGVYLNGLFDNAALYNTGTIAVNATDATPISGNTAYAYGLDVGSVASGATIDNTGSISVEATSDNGEAYAYGVYVWGNMDGTFTNDGTIKAKASGATGSGGIAVYMSSGSGSLVNNGQIDGALRTFGSVAVSNAGNITTRGDTGSYVAGNYTQEAGGTLTQVLRSTSEYGQFRVDGTADFTAGNTVIIKTDAQSSLHDGDWFDDVVSSSNNLVGNAGIFNVIDASAFWNFEVSVDANSLNLQVDYVPAKQAVGDFDISGSMASFVDGVIADGSSGPFADLAAALNEAGSSDEVVKILNGISPSLGAAQATKVANENADNVVDMRLSDTGGSSGDAFKNLGWWIKPYFGTATQDDANGAVGYDVDTNGFVLGVDGEMSSALRAGVAVASSSANVDGTGSSLDLSSVQVIGYGAYDLGKGSSLNFKLGYGTNSYDSNRKVTIANDVAVASYDGTQVSAGIDWTHVKKMSEKNTFVPSVGVQYTKVEVDAYKEKGAGIYNLNANSADDDSLIVSANAGFEHELSKNSALLANVGLGYDTSTDVASVTASLSGGGSKFASTGIDPEAMIYNAGLGYRYITSKDLEISANYDLEARSDFMANTVSVKFKMPF